MLACGRRDSCGSCRFRRSQEGDAAVCGAGAACGKSGEACAQRVSAPPPPAPPARARTRRGGCPVWAARKRASAGPGERL
eukprot:354448-Chlamydomonas_euryale.AAC.8